jgi:formyltetrahydrofolate-dependent phosphoribosylglycinamide formyltransferase
MREVPVAVLLSGRGSNMQALVAAARAPDCPYRVILVASDQADAAGLAWAAEQGIATLHASPKGRPKAEYEAEVEAALHVHGAALIALAGYMRLLSPGFVARWRGRILNIHPSLLPRYKGLDTHARAIAAGDAVAGCSVHLVTEELDAGEVLGRAEVPILPGDTPDTLAARVLAEEHRLYPRVLADYAKAMTDPATRVRQLALQLPGAHEAEGGFHVEGACFARLDGAMLHVLGDDGRWDEVDLAGASDWSLVEDRIAHGWELAAPQELLEAGGR